MVGRRKPSRPEGAVDPDLPVRPIPLTANRRMLARLTSLGEVQCAIEEAAAILGTDPAALRAFLARSLRARAAFEGARAGGLESLRRTQFKLSETNAAMVIVLGKTYLGQSDRRELERSGAID